MIKYGIENNKDKYDRDRVNVKNSLAVLLINLEEDSRHLET